jgi:hypothetical protein
LSAFLRTDDKDEDEDDEDDDDDDDDDDDKPLTEQPRSSSAPSSASSSSLSAVTSMTSTSAASQTQRLDDGLFDDRGDSSETAEQLDSIDYVHVQLPVAAATSNGGHADNLEKSPLTANQVKLINVCDSINLPLNIIDTLCVALSHIAVV